ncbi:MAG TPA: hypothetical protein EYQ81_00895 [Sneathiellales bacterium]|nr:hypothetical protein [Sneathiellales bacterium]
MPTYQLKIANSKPLRGALLMNGVESQASALPHDAALVQVLLKSTHRPGSLDPLYKGRIDGQAGPKIVVAIRSFQEMEGVPLGLGRTHVPEGPRRFRRGGSQ